MIELLKTLPLSKNYTIVDVGTGSGVLAITAKLELPNSKVIATDIDESCLRVAKKNAKNYKIDLKFIKGDLLKPLLKLKFLEANLVLMANLPYVPDKFTLNEAAMNEPRIAIFGGSDGLEVYRRFFKQLAASNLSPKFVLTESLPFQHQKLTKIGLSTAFKMRAVDDFIQVFVAN
jgi:release factor glutamine methyltransferase